MYFINDIHNQNYIECMEQFNCNNREYISACYIAAYPEIFKCFSLSYQFNGPFDWFFEHLYTVDIPNANDAQKNGDAAPLTGQTTALVHLGLNLWNGHSFDLASGLSIWDSELYSVALQAINLRWEDRNQ
ncbi:hypothetical protein [Paenibacillus paeoniae]|uniref:Uncharacterized protein n=1 Tax=Paenibacillus paeoniae TaxID=2292705 RepID=A0A371P6A8_9BACL|nr:hypothetical protein [Paenibacillus paeoniae]REK71487.1 hypothetical protein DX130_21035 [Paenibacillus paeoniae]